MTDSGVPPMACAGRQALEDAQVYERYLQGRLPEDEAQRFERHYVECDVCLEQLETTEALLDGLRRAAVEDVAKINAASQVAVAWYRRRHVPWAALVLGLFLGFAGSWLDRNISQGPERVQLPAALPWGDPLALTLAPLRGDGAGDAEVAYRLHLPPEPTPLHVTLPLALPPGGRYGIALTTSEGVPIWRLDRLGANADGELQLAVPSTVLKPGIVHLEVESADGASAVRQVARLRFEVITPEPSASR